jgi:hypothetical protein
LAIERGNDKETEGNLIRRVIALIGLFKQQGKGKGRRQESRLRRRAGEAEEKKKGRGERKLTGGTQSSARAKKWKKREMTWIGAERGWRAAGPLGPKGKKVPFFFPFSFSNSFKTNFSFQIQTKSFQTFSQKFYKLFRSHISNQKPCKAN